MLGFLEFLEESSWSKAIWHGATREFEPNKIRPGSHFGNLSAAVDRGLSKPYDRFNPVRKVMAFNYKPSGKTVRVDDTWDDDRPEPYIAQQLRDKKILDPKLVGFMEKTRYPQRAMMKALRHKGISTLTYKNKYEGDKRDSTIIYDPQSLQHKHTFSSPNVIEPKSVPKPDDRPAWSRLYKRQNVFGASKLAEHIISIGLNPKHEKYREKLRDQIHKVLQKSYANVEGGYGDLGSGSAAEARAIHADISDASHIKATVRNGVVTTATLYKARKGRKFIATGVNPDAPTGKADWRKTASEDKGRNVWGEVSGRAEGAKRKLGYPQVPAKHAKELTGKDVKVIDADRYQRKIGNKVHTKTILGFPKH